MLNHLPEKLTGRAVGQVPAHGEVHAHDRVAGLEHREVDGHVGLRAGVRLDVGVVGAEQLARAVAREVLDDVDLLAPAVVALAGQALGVLVGERRARRLEDGHRHEVLRGDELDRGALAVQLGIDRCGDLGILGRDVLQRHDVLTSFPRTYS